MKRIVAAILLAMTLLCLGSCTKPTVSSTPEGKVEDYQFTETAEQTNFVKIEMMDGSIILIELYPDIAPLTVKNFKGLVAVNFYDGIIFHRVIEGFMIQGGDPDGDGIGGSSETIKGEFAANGVENNLKHTRGVISMARTSQSYNSASSQFFIMHQDYPRLDGQYAAFGKVIAGMDTVDKIATVRTNMNDRPLEEQKMKSIRFVVIEGMEGETK
jgi:peptidyl-prolyl cis-trans isomerase B (cyclophilin B)